MNSPAKNFDNQPVILCVTSNRNQRAQVARRTSGCGVLLMFPDLESVRTVLFGEAPATGIAGPAAGAVGLGRLVVDVDRQQVNWAGRVLPLTRLEREVLVALATPPLRVWSYGQLYERAWGADYLDDASAVRSTVKRLRGKLRSAGVAASIDSVWGVGFSLVDTSG